MSIKAVMINPCALMTIVRSETKVIVRKMAMKQLAIAKRVILQVPCSKNRNKIGLQKSQNP